MRGGPISSSPSTRLTSRRDDLVRDVERHLEQEHWPRLTLATILAVSGLVAFLASYAALALGVASMALRYGLASVVGYLTFLGGVRLWVHYRTEPSDLDWGIPNLGDAAALDLPDPGPVPFAFDGGEGFGGGGAGRVVDGTGALAPEELVEVAAEAGDESVVIIPVAIVLAVAGALVVGLLSTTTVVLGAPTLFAEVAIDAVIAGTVYRRLVRRSPQHWVTSAVRLTWKPMLAIATTAVLVGLVIQWRLPDAVSLGDIFR